MALLLVVMAQAESQVPGYPGDTPRPGLTNSSAGTNTRTFPPRLENDAVTFIYPLSEVIPCCKCRDHLPTTSFSHECRMDEFELSL